ncbi:hypothetical protein HZH68_009059 [Vespula germanica]|uniref:Uncharacterized protein n=1 Tax=Vespula germanica TaxID=30212 RepID=A0A834K0H7_VESGE|nr:hypothetical protein HZH68_009059 [Vespula germanica]
MVFGGSRDCGLRANARDAPFHPSFRVAIGTIVILILITSQPSFSQESLANRMRVISEDLDRQLNDIMASQAVNYTTVNTTGLPYNATTKFNPKGMGQLYNVTNMFIDFIQSKQAYPEERVDEHIGTPRRARLRPAPPGPRENGRQLVGKQIAVKRPSVEFDKNEIVFVSYCVFI